MHAFPSILKVPDPKANLSHSVLRSPWYRGWQPKGSRRRSCRMKSYRAHQTTPASVFPSQRLDSSSIAAGPPFTGWSSYLSLAPSLFGPWVSTNGSTCRSIQSDEAVRHVSDGTSRGAVGSSASCSTQRWIRAIKMASLSVATGCVRTPSSLLDRHRTTRVDRSCRRILPHNHEAG